MSEQQTKKPSILKSLLTVVIVLAVIIAIIVGLGALRLPTWPLIFFLFYFSTVAGMDKKKLWITAAGGFIGMTVGFSQGLVTLATGNETAGFIVFMVLIVCMVTAVVDGRLKVVDPFCLMMLTCLTSFTGITPPETYHLCLITYALAVGLFALITTLQSKQVKPDA